MQPKKPSILAISAMVVIFLAIVLMVISMIPWASWATFDRTRAIGPVNYHLEADFDAVGFQYTMETVESEGGGGGLIGGDLGSDFNISREKTYPQVRGEFLENIGIIYNSYNNKAFQYELKMWSPPEESGIEWEGVGNPSVLLNITLESDLIPWWPESGDRTLDVNIELLKVDMWDLVGAEDRANLNIQVNSVSIWAKTGYNTETGEYVGEDKQLAKRDVSFDFQEPGQIEKLDFSVSYPSGTDAAGFYTVISGNMTDFWGRSELSPLAGKANPINVYPMSTGKVIQGVGIPLALPLMIISSILGIIAIILAIFKGNFNIPLMAASSIIAMIAPLWFYLGMNAAVELLGERLTGAEEGLTWGAGIFISTAGATLMMAALVITIVSCIRSRKSGGNTSSETQKEGPVFKKIPDEKVDPQPTGPTFKKL